MNERNYLAQLKEVKIGIIISLMTLLYGFGLGGVFGAFEDAIKGHLKKEAELVADSKYSGDAKKMKKVYDKAWVYFKRAHLHANGLGTSSLAMILLLSVLPTSLLVKKITASALGIGSLGYSLFWMFAGLRAPGLGSTGAAKETLEWLAIPTSACCIIGLISVFVIVVTSMFRENSSN